MKNAMQNTFISIAVISLFASCAGSSSNPLDKYPGLKSAPPSDAKVESQTIAPPDLFDIQVNDSANVEQAQFTEGQSSQVLLRVTSKSAQVQSYKIEMTDFSSLDRPTLVSTKEANVFALQWTPPTGTIPGGQTNKSFTAKFLVTSTSASNQLLVGLTKVKDLNVIVNRNNSQPHLTVSELSFKNGVDEDADPTFFTIDVDDPSSANSPRLPNISPDALIYANTEAYRADAWPYISLVADPKKQNPQKIAGTNTFRFFYSMKLANLPLDRDRLGNEIPSASTLDMCFQLRAVSAVLTWSDEKQVCFTARYATQPPVLAFNEAELKAIKSGQDNTISFKATADHPKAVVTLKNAASQIAGLSGTKSLTCTYADPSKQNELSCVLAWKPLCQKADSTKTLTLKVDNTLNSKTKTTTEVKQFNILADPNQCAKPKAGQS